MSRRSEGKRDDPKSSSEKYHQYIDMTGLIMSLGLFYSLSIFLSGSLVQLFRPWRGVDYPLCEATRSAGRYKWAGGTDRQARISTL